MLRNTSKWGYSILFVYLAGSPSPTTTNRGRMLAPLPFCVLTKAIHPHRQGHRRKKEETNMKRLLLLSALALSLHATSWAYDFEVDNIQYTILSFDKMTVEVSGLSDDSVTEVVIPETVEYRSRTLTVTSIGNSAFFNCTSLSHVTIGNNVITISKEAFAYCI